MLAHMFCIYWGMSYVQICCTRRCLPLLCADLFCVVSLVYLVCVVLPFVVSDGWTGGQADGQLADQLVGRSVGRSVDRSVGR